MQVIGEQMRVLRAEDFQPVHVAEVAVPVRLEDGDGSGDLLAHRSDGEPDLVRLRLPPSGVDGRNNGKGHVRVPLADDPDKPDDRRAKGAGAQATGVMDIDADLHGK